MSLMDGGGGLKKGLECQAEECGFTLAVNGDLERSFQGKDVSRFLTQVLRGHSQSVGLGGQSGGSQEDPRRRWGGWWGGVGSSGRGEAGPGRTGSPWSCLRVKERKGDLDSGAS